MEQGTRRAREPKAPDGERIAKLEERIQSLATSAQVTTLQEAIKSLADLNTRQHNEMAARLFGSDPTSIQSQITTVNERAFGDSVVSLKSRITAQEKDTAVSRGKLALLVALITGLGAFLAIKFQTIAGWFGFFPKSPVVPMAGMCITVVSRDRLYRLCEKLDARLGRCVDRFKACPLWTSRVWRRIRRCFSGC